MRPKTPPPHTVFGSPLVGNYQEGRYKFPELGTVDIEFARTRSKSAFKLAPETYTLWLYAQGRVVPGCTKQDVPVEGFEDAVQEMFGKYSDVLSNEIEDARRKLEELSEIKAAIDTLK